MWYVEICQVVLDESVILTSARSSSLFFFILLYITLNGDIIILYVYDSHIICKYIYTEKYRKYKISYFLFHSSCIVRITRYYIFHKFTGKGNVLLRNPK